MTGPTAENSGHAVFKYVWQTGFDGRVRGYRMVGVDVIGNVEVREESCKAMDRTT